MNGYPLILGGARLLALASGALYWPDAGLIAVSDLHLGKARRAARRGGALLPPYEVAETLERLEAALAATGALTVVSLGDAFDDAGAAAELAGGEARIRGLMAGRRWLWITGNHDPGPAPGGETLPQAIIGPLTFRHIAEPRAAAEISGHYHPKARLALGGAVMSRPCFLADGQRIILPAFGTYTGGLDCRSPALAGLMERAVAVLTGRSVRAIPLAAA